MDRSKITLRQAEGLDELPKPLAKDEMPKKLKVFLWNTLYWFLENSTTKPVGGGLKFTPQWHRIFRSAHQYYFHEPVDEFNNDCFEISNKYKKIFLEGDWSLVLDLIQFILRHPDCPDMFKRTVEKHLHDCQSPWVIIGEGDETTLVPSASEQETTTIENAYEELKNSGFGGAHKHLVKSLEYFANGNHSSSIRESISMVESVAKKITRDESADLSKALKQLEDKGIIIHGALKSGFDKLYGYTSDEDGIRHSQVDFDENTDEIDAQFMIGSCAAFVSYLIGKARTAGVIIQ